MTRTQKARRLGGWYAVATMLIGVWVLQLIWISPGEAGLPFHLRSALLILPFVAYRFGTIAGTRILIEDESAIWQGIACVITVSSLCLTWLYVADVLHAFIMGVGPTFDFSSFNDAMKYLVKGTAPIAPLGLIMGAALGLWRE